MSLSGRNGFGEKSVEGFGRNGDASSNEAMVFRVGEEEEEEEEKMKKDRVRGSSSGALNTTKHLLAGAVSAMVSRFIFLHPSFVNLSYYF